MSRSRKGRRGVSALALGGAALLLAGCFSLHDAANRGNLALVKTKLRQGADVNARDRYGRTPLMYMLTDLTSVQYLAGQGADVNVRDIRGQTPLMQAAWLGQPEVVRFLVKEGAEVDARNDSGQTALMQATRSLDVVKFLVAQGADINAADDRGETVLLKAAMDGRLSVVRYLLDAGAEVAEPGDAP